MAAFIPGGTELCVALKRPYIPHAYTILCNQSQQTVHELKNGGAQACGAVRMLVTASRGGRPRPAPHVAAFRRRPQAHRRGGLRGRSWSRAAHTPPLRWARCRPALATWRLPLARAPSHVRNPPAQLVVVRERPVVVVVMRECRVAV